MLHQLSLNGPWLLRGSDEQRDRAAHALKDSPDLARYLPATVPGEVHLDLLRAGHIPDPCLGTNVLACRWVEEYLWAYRREFTAPAAATRGGKSRAWLVFDALDLIAKIYLNGQLVGSHRNAFYPCRLEVTGKLKPGKNTLVVILDSGLWDTADKPAAGYIFTPDGALHKRHWMRKPQCQFSWDWAPRLVNVGIPGNVRLEWTAAPARLDQLVPLITVADDLKSATVTARLFVEGLADKPTKATLRIQIPEAKLTAAVPVELKPGLHPVEATLTVPNPKLWWPVHHGPQPLYTLRATLTTDHGPLTTDRRIGFRHVRINQTPHPQGGHYFVFEINHRPIFCKGGNLVPADLIPARLDANRYQTLVDRALEANFNFLRVWGGGLYEAEALYDECNRRGVLVWQEFIYACSKYPMTDQAFFDDAKREATYQIRRLAAHPSLVAWCGNNENEQGNWHWGYDKGTVHPDYAFFHLTLPRLLAAEDPTRHYQPSSPWSGPAVDPLRHDTGDQHPWEIGFADTDYRKYRTFISRFPNEGGILGPTALPTMLACLEGNGHHGDPKQKTVGSWPWRVHENSVDAWAEPSLALAMLPLHLGRSERDMSIEEFTYWAGLVQSEGLTDYIRNFRRRMFSSSSAIFWMYNDTWPAVRSWTIVDYYLRRTPAFWAVKRAMQPVAVAVAEAGDEVVVFGINETRDPIAADLRYGVFDLAGPYQLDQTTPVTLAPNASTPLARFPKAKWKRPHASAAFAMLTQAGRLLARDRLTLGLIKEMQWPKPSLRVTLKNGQALFRSRTFVLGVCLDLNGETPLPDNFFDLYPGVDYALPWRGRTAPKVMNIK